MSKYITHFMTEAAYQAALPTLDLPNVSLVDELNEVHYHRALYGASAGDIVLYDTAEAQKIVVAQNDWNTNDYPFASYPVIGVAISESADGLLVVGALNIDMTTSDTLYKWQTQSNLDWGQTKYTNSGVGVVNEYNGKSNTYNIVAKVNAAGYGGDNTIVGHIGSYYTDGTNQGDWYVGADGEVYQLYENYSAINSGLAKIASADNTKALQLSSNYYWSSSEYSSGTARSVYLINGNVYHENKSNSNRVRAFLRVGA